MSLNLDRTIAEWLVDGPAGDHQDAIERALEIVARTGQRPAWAVVDTWRDPWTGGISTRTIRLVVVLLLLAALLAALVAVGSRPPTPEDLVRLSQAVHQDPPAFQMLTTTMSHPDGSGVGCPLQSGLGEGVSTFRFLYDGATGFREECYADGHLSEMYVSDGRTSGWFHEGKWTAEPARRTFGSLGDGPVPQLPPATIPVLNWVQVGFGMEGEPSPPGEKVSCGSWSVGASVVVADRRATEVACGEATFTIDDASRLIVALESPVGTMRATRLTLGQPTADLFAVQPPSNVRSALIEGGAPVDWTLPTADRGSLTWSSLAGRPVVAFTRTSRCASDCLPLEEFVAGVLPHIGEVRAVAIFEGSSAPGAAAAASAGIPVVIDDGTSTTGWLHVDGVSLFDAALTYRGTVDARSPESVSAAVEAIRSGGSLPPVPPGDGTFSVGQPAPPLVSQTLDGAPFDIASLRGRPVVVLSTNWEHLDPDRMAAAERLLTDFTQAHESAGDRAAFVVIAWEVGYSGPPAAEWADLRRTVAARHPGSTEITYIAHDTYGSEGWTPIAWVGGGFPQDRWDPAIVVLDADGLVVRLIGEPLPTPSELAAIVREEADR